MEKQIYFKERQVFYIALIPSAFFILIINLFYFLQIGSKKIDFGSYLFLSMIFIVLGLLFYQLKISIYKDYLKISFGIGLIKRKIFIKNLNLKSFKLLKIPIYYGVGIRFFTRGIIYNTKPGEGLLFKIKDTNKKIIIVSNENLEIKKTLENLIE